MLALEFEIFRFLADVALVFSTLLFGVLAFRAIVSRFVLATVVLATVVLATVVLATVVLATVVLATVVLATVVLATVVLALTVFALGSLVSASVFTTFAGPLVLPRKGTESLVVFVDRFLASRLAEHCRSLREKLGDLRGLLQFFLMLLERVGELFQVIFFRFALRVAELSLEGPDFVSPLVELSVGAQRFEFEPKLRRLGFLALPFGLVEAISELLALLVEIELSLFVREFLA
ncbi:MAG: hypothetical protein AAF517_12595 [Planctomycetota bacterium]